MTKSCTIPLFVTHCFFTIHLEIDICNVFFFYIEHILKTLNYVRNLSSYLYAEVDTSPPQILNYPSNIESTTEVGLTGQIITWNEPSAVDASGNVTLLLKTHSSGDIFNAGSTTVFYMFEDSSHNIAVCSFIIQITAGKVIYFTVWFEIENARALCQILL